MANIHKASFTFNSKGVHGNPCQLPDYKGGHVPKEQGLKCCGRGLGLCNTDDIKVV